MQSVTKFRDLGRVLTNTDDDWPAVARNLRKARVTWGRLARILGREGGGPEGVTQFLYCRDTAGPPLRGGDLGSYQKDGGCPERVPGQGSTAADGAHATPWEGREVTVPPHGGSYQGSGDSAGEDIGPPETEYGRAICCDAADSGTL